MIPLRTLFNHTFITLIVSIDHFTGDTAPDSNLTQALVSKACSKETGNS